MRKGMLLLTVIALASFAVAQNGSMVGIWKMNVAKSNFGKMPAPKSAMVNIMDDKDSSLKWTYTETAADGKVNKSSYSGAFDGKQHPVTGTDPMLKSGAFTRKGDNVEITWMMKDGSTAKESSTVSGNTMTNVETDKDGNKVTTVWERGATTSKGAAAKSSAEKPAAKKAPGK